MTECHLIGIYEINRIPLNVEDMLKLSTQKMAVLRLDDNIIFSSEIKDFAGVVIIDHLKTKSDVNDLIKRIELLKGIVPYKNIFAFGLAEAEAQRYLPLLSKHCRYEFVRVGTSINGMLIKLRYRLQQLLQNYLDKDAAVTVVKGGKVNEKVMELRSKTEKIYEHETRLSGDETENVEEFEVGGANRFDGSFEGDQNASSDWIVQLRPEEELTAELELEKSVWNIPENTHIVLLSQNRIDVEFLLNVIKQREINFHIYHHLGDLLESHTDWENSVLVIDASFVDADYESEEEFVYAVKAFLSNCLRPHQIFVMTNKTQFTRIPFFDGKESFFGQQIFRNPKVPVASIFSHSIPLALMNDRLPTVKSFLPEGKDPQKLRITKSVARKAAVSAIASFLKKADIPSRLSNQVASAIDELLIFSLFVAPIGSKGERYRNRLDRKLEFPLNSREVLELDLCDSGDMIGLSVSDRFGSLDTQKVSRIFWTMMNEPNLTISEKGSPEEYFCLGLRGVIKTGVSLYLCVRPGVCSRLMLFFPRVSRVKDIFERFQFIGFKNLSKEQ